MIFKKHKEKSKNISKNKIIGKKTPNIGDIKKVIKFAFFPVKITETDNHVIYVWFERYIEINEFRYIPNLVKVFTDKKEPNCCILDVGWRCKEKKLYTKKKNKKF